MKIEDTRKNWKDAFKCSKCARGEKTDCPCYVEWVETNNITGEQRIRKGCIFQLLPELLIQNTKQASGVQASTESLRNVLDKRLREALQLKAKALEEDK